MSEILAQDQYDTQVDDAFFSASWGAILNESAVYEDPLEILDEALAEGQLLDHHKANKGYAEETYRGEVDHNRKKEFRHLNLNLRNINLHKGCHSN